MKTCEIGDRRGRALRRIDFSRQLAAYGPTHFTTHIELIALPRRAGGQQVELAHGDHRERA